MRSTKQQVEAGFWAIGLACASYLLFLAAQAQVFHHRATHLGAVSLVPPTATTVSAASGEVIGHIEIPRLNLSVAVLEDDESKSLLRGLGHVPGTAELGGLGTVGLAGHRDTFLRPLRYVAPGMEIRASNTRGIYHYVVDSTEIVQPEAVDVLAIGAQPELILITCYPFSYVGHAPKRFVVHAHLISVSPDAGTF